MTRNKKTKTVRNVVTISKDIHLRLKELADRSGLKIGWIASLAITQYLDRERRGQPQEKANGV